MDNQVYFITGCCRDYFPALESEQAKQVIWERLEHYCNEFEFFLWIASVMSNHDHLIGYSRSGANLKKIMQRSTDRRPSSSTICSPSAAPISDATRRVANISTGACAMRSSAVPRIDTPKCRLDGTE
jgi:hypothetical protein